MLLSLEAMHPSNHELELQCDVTFEYGLPSSFGAILNYLNKGVDHWVRQGLISKLIHLIPFLMT